MSTTTSRVFFALSAKEYDEDGYSVAHSENGYISTSTHVRDDAAIVGGSIGSLGVPVGVVTINNGQDSVTTLFLHNEAQLVALRQAVNVALREVRKAAKEA